MCPNHNVYTPSDDSIQGSLPAIDCHRHLIGRRKTDTNWRRHRRIKLVFGLSVWLIEVGDPQHGLSLEKLGHTYPTLQGAIIGRASTRQAHRIPNFPVEPFDYICPARTFSSRDEDLRMGGQGGEMELLLQISHSLPNEAVTRHNCNNVFKVTVFRKDEIDIMYQPFERSTDN